MEPARADPADDHAAVAGAGADGVRRLLRAHRSTLPAGARRRERARRSRRAGRRRERAHGMKGQGMGEQRVARQGAAGPADQEHGAAEPAAASAKPRFNRFIIPLAAFLGIAAVLAVGIINSRSVGVIQSPLIGKPAPAWSLPVLDGGGRTFGSKDLAGKWYVLNVWGSWCYACKDEHEELLKISRSSSVPLIGIDWNDDDAQARNYLANLGNPYRMVTTDHDGHVVIDWGVYGAPETFLVNPEGMVVYKQTGAMTPEVWEKEFASRLPAALADRGS